MSRKLWIVLTVALVVALVATTLVGCNDEEKAEAAKYTVTVDLNYEGATATTLTVDSGEAIAKTVLKDPEREGYVFGGWFLDAACVTPLTFENGKSAAAVTTDITIYARWTAIELASISAEYVGGEKQVGDAITAADFKVTATYTDGKTAEVTKGIVVSVPTLTKVGANEIALTYVEAGVTKSVTISVTAKEVSAPETVTLESITVKYTGGELTAGDSIPTDKVSVTAVYSDGSKKENVKGFALKDYDKTEGKRTITVTYEGKEATFEVTFKAAATVKVMQSIRAEYTGGELVAGSAIDPADVTIYAVYGEGDEEVIDVEFRFAENYNNTVGTNDIRLFYVDGSGKSFAAVIRVTFKAAAAPEWTASEETRTIYFTNNKGWSKVYLYAWVVEDGETHVLKAWNKEEEQYPNEMEFVGKNGESEDVYGFEFSVSYANILFTDGSVQTVDITLADDVNAYYLDGGAVNESGKWAVGTWNCDPEALNVPKTIKGIRAEYTGSNLVAGSEIDPADVTIYAIYGEDDEEVIDVEFRFAENYNNTVGTNDIRLFYTDGSGTTFNAVISVTFVAAAPETRTVYFVNSEGWNKVYAYVWVNDDETDFVEAFPGSVMSFDYTDGEGNGVYTFTFASKYDRIIFSNGSNAEQTENITVGSKNAFGLTTKDVKWGYSESDVDLEALTPWDGTITIDVNGVVGDGNKWFENDGYVAYVYVWYTTGENAPYITADGADPADYKANREAAYLYTFETDATRTIAGIKVVRGNPDGTDFPNATGDLTDDGSHYFAVTSMS